MDRKDECDGRRDESASLNDTSLSFQANIPSRQFPRYQAVEKDSIGCVAPASCR